MKMKFPSKNLLHLSIGLFGDDIFKHVSYYNCIPKITSIGYPVPIDTQQLKRAVYVQNFWEIRKNDFFFKPSKSNSSTRKK